MDIVHCHSLHSVRWVYDAAYSLPSWSRSHNTLKPSTTFNALSVSNISQCPSLLSMLLRTAPDQHLLGRSLTAQVSLSLLTCGGLHPCIIDLYPTLPDLPPPRLRLGSRLVSRSITEDFYSQLHGLCTKDMDVYSKSVWGNSLHSASYSVPAML